MTNRRRFISASIIGAAGASFLSSKTQAQEKNPPFALKFAPHPGMFIHHAGPDVLEQIRFAADQGFTAWEDNGVKQHSPEMQEKIGALLKEKNMTMGVFVAYGEFERPTFAIKKAEYQDEVLSSIKGSVDVAKRVGAKWMTVVPGTIAQQFKDDPNWKKYGGPRLDSDLQLANVIELLRRCADILEPHGLVMVLEPLNTKVDHGGVFLNSSTQAYAICKAVDSPSCKILHDVYHLQIEEGHIISTIDHCWDEIAYMQSGDNPGRKEPGTGEMNYTNIFRHLKNKNFQGVIGMEHGNSQPGKEGEAAVIAAYRAVNPA
jgi:hydroxypyruvate isomerase